MKKNTLAKWLLTGAVMVVSFACQSQTTSDSAQVPNDETEVPLGASAPNSSNANKNANVRNAPKTPH